MTSLIFRININNYKCNKEELEGDTKVQLQIAWVYQILTSKTYNLDILIVKLAENVALLCLSRNFHTADNHAIHVLTDLLKDCKGFN